MSTTTATPVHVARPAASRGAGHVLLIVFGGISLLVALALVAGGVAAVWGLSQRDGSGYFTSGSHQLSTSSYAIVTDSLNVGTDAPGWVFGDHFATARIQATSSQPVFVGIARTSDVNRYLTAVQHDQITNLDVQPFTVSYRRQGGSARPTAPAGESFWRVKASGSGTQTIRWPLESGNWSAVAMNADGSPGVTVDTRFGARIPWFRWIAIGFLAGGGLVLLAGSALVYLGARRPRPVTRQDVTPQSVARQ
jgi:hypothetical protein